MVRVRTPLLTIAMFVLTGVEMGQGQMNSVDLGRISGRVVDRRGVPIQNQTIRLKPAKTTDAAATTQTDQDGVFTFAAAVAAPYEIIFEVPGFKRLVVPVNRAVGGDHVNLGTIVLEIYPIGDGIE